MAQQQSDTALLLLDLQNEMVDPKGYFGAMGLAKAAADGNVLICCAQPRGAVVLDL